MQLRFVAFLQGHLKRSPAIVPGSSFYYWRTLERRISRKKAEAILKRCRVTWSAFIRGSKRTAKERTAPPSAISVAADALAAAIADINEGTLRQEKLFKVGVCVHACITTAVWTIDLTTLKGSCWVSLKRNGEACLEGFYSSSLRGEIRRVIQDAHSNTVRRTRSKLPIGSLQKRLMKLHSPPT